jgi:hypothetical protein
MTRKVWVPTGNLAWRKPSGDDKKSRHDDAIFQDYWENEWILVQEVVEIEVDDEEATYTGAVEWRPIPILPENPPPPKNEGFMQCNTVVTNTEPKS